MTNKVQCSNCYLYVLNTLADWEIGFLTAELTSKRYFAKDTQLHFTKIGNSLEPITTMGGMIITPDKDINDITFHKGDLLILPGADTWQDGTNQKIIDIVKKVIDSGVTIAAICGATVALAGNGLLNNRKHTSNDKDFLKMVCPEYSGGSYYENRPAAVGNDLITASGDAPLEFSYEVLKKMNVMKAETLEAWYQLYRTHEPGFFYDLVESLK